MATISAHRAYNAFTFHASCIVTIQLVGGDCWCTVVDTRYDALPTLHSTWLGHCGAGVVSAYGCDDPTLGEKAMKEFVGVASMGIFWIWLGGMLIVAYLCTREGDF